ncbi:MAG TPA: hypothetical protein IAB23_03120 [Candidatus Scybalocola faecavium]|nr:hypothetical protein [Candidatus Scybalocola faecavium]
MKDLRKILYILAGQLKASAVSIRVWLGYAIGITVALKNAYAYCGYAGERVFQIFEPYMESFINTGDVFILLIGYILIISDAPFINRRSTLMLYRSSRGQWFWGMGLYMIIHCILYYVISGVACMIYCIRQGYVDDLWSMPMRNLALYPSLEAAEWWRLPLPPERLITDFTPTGAMIHTLLLLAVYSLILGFILFIFNTLWNQAVGAALTASIHILGYILAFGGFGGLLPRWSLLNNSMFMTVIAGISSIPHAYLLLLLVLCLLLFSGPSLMKRADFVHTTGESNE